MFYKIKKFPALLKTNLSAHNNLIKNKIKIFNLLPYEGSHLYRSGNPDTPKPYDNIVLIKGSNEHFHVYYNHETAFECIQGHFFNINPQVSEAFLFYLNKLNT